MSRQSLKDALIRAGMIVESKTPDGIGVTAVKTSGTIEYKGRRMFAELIGGADEPAPWNIVRSRWVLTILRRGGIP